MSEGNRTGEKIVFFAIAIPVILGIGMIFPGIGHAVLAGIGAYCYKEIFG